MRIVLFTIAIIMSASAWGQLLDGAASLFSGFQDIPVGIVWAQPTGDPCRYTEYWFLGPDYIYPNTPGVYAELRVKPDESRLEFDNPFEFYDYARVMFPGGKRVISEVVELENCGPCSASASSQFQFELGSLPCDR